MKTCYTAIFSKYDDLKEPIVKKQRGWKFVCFTDQNIESDTWEVKKVPLIDENPVKTARWYKINAHKCVDSELTLWLDATFIINTDLNKWWRKFKAPFTAIQHPFDNCIYTDAESCLSGGKGEKNLIERQIAFYRAIGVPKDNGLIASGILMRQRVSATNEFCRTWWEQVRRWSSRDQIAYGYANHKHPNTVNLIEWNYTTEKEFIHIPHLHKPWRERMLNAAYEFKGK